VLYRVLPGVCTVDPASGEWCELDGVLVAPEDKYAYAHDLLGRVTSVTDPNGSVFTRVYDAPRMGVLNEVQVARAAGVGGAARVTYEYGDGSACSCSDGSYPTRIVTYDAAGACRTRIDREYNALGDVEREEVRVSATCTPPLPGQTPCEGAWDWGYVLRYERDSDADPTRRDTSIVLDGGAHFGANGPRIRRVFDANGRIAEVRRDMFSGAADQEVARYWYQGAGKVRESEYEYEVPSQVRRKVIRRASYDGGGFGKRMANLWLANVWDFGAGGWEGEDVVYDWSATYDAANRIATKKIGPAAESFVYEFVFDDRDKLKQTEYVWPDDPLPLRQLRDYRTVDYGWDEAGRASGQTQCFMPSEGPVVCEPDPYVFVRDSRGRITAVTGTHVFAYHANGIEPRRQTGPQARTNDPNGNVRTISFSYTTHNPVIPPLNCDIETCAGVNERSEQPHAWSFTYDAWDRMVQATKTVEIEPYHYGTLAEGCCLDIADEPLGYAVTYSFEYDGEGRRVLTGIAVTGDAAAAGVAPQAWLNVYDAFGRMVERVDADGDAEVEDIFYVHGAEEMPVLGLFTADNAGGAPDFFVTDVEGNVGALMDAADGSASDAKSTAHCGSESSSDSKGKGGDPGSQKTPGNAHSNSYGSSEDGFALVNDENASALVFMAEGEVKDTEEKGEKEKAAIIDVGKPPKPVKCEWAKVDVAPETRRKDDWEYTGTGTNALRGLFDYSQWKGVVEVTPTDDGGTGVIDVEYYHEHALILKKEYNALNEKWTRKHTCQLDKGECIIGLKEARRENREFRKNRLFGIFDVVVSKVDTHPKSRLRIKGTADVWVGEITETKPLGIGSVSVKGSAPAGVGTAEGTITLPGGGQIASTIKRNWPAASLEWEIRCKEKAAAGGTDG
jgi:hypothetical protein